MDEGSMIGWNPNPMEVGLPCPFWALEMTGRESGYDFKTGIWVEDAFHS
jgi:hypothetical protein